jgi:DNA polymerase III delta prime subunit
MISKTFLHKYKPIFLEDFYLGNELYDMLNLFIQINNINVLLIGNTSSGKTSILNAIIRKYYNLSQADYFPKSNILIVNNLKEQGIQYFRGEMKTFCQSKSTIFGKKKLLIIDDIDNVNDHCQQVFRNYIDKYSSNINFISTCTNSQKVIESIQSRIHMLKINNISKSNTLSIIEKIISNEQISITDEAKQYLIHVTNSSIRQIINYLEKFHILDYNIDLDTCKKLCSNINIDDFEIYLKLVKSNDLIESYHYFNKLYDFGFSVLDILDYFFTFIKQTDMINESEKYQIIPIICKYITIFHNVHENQIELAFFTKDLCKLFAENKI